MRATKPKGSRDLLMTVEADEQKAIDLLWKALTAPDVTKRNAVTTRG